MNKPGDAGVAGRTRPVADETQCAAKTLARDPAKWNPVRRQDHAALHQAGARSDAKRESTFADRTPQRN
jgi:hypothetical protein